MVRMSLMFGLAPNARLKAVLAPEAQRGRTTGKAARLAQDLLEPTGGLWARPMPDGATARGDQPGQGKDRARGLYELYCARGEMENRIKECQLDLFADRTSSATMQANQLRLWFASMAYVLLSELRRIALRHTQAPPAAPSG